MSYDVGFVYVNDCSGVLSEARRRWSEPEPVPNDADDRRRQALVDDILSLHPSLKMEPHHKSGFSHGCWIGGRDSDCPFPYVEFAVQSALVSVSYSADPEALRSIDALSHVFSRHGYVGYDPQTDSLWSSESAIERFGGTRSTVSQMLSGIGETAIQPELDHPKQPWWKFW